MGKYPGWLLTGKQLRGALQLLGASIMISSGFCSSCEIPIPIKIQKDGPLEMGDMEPGKQLGAQGPEPTLFARCPLRGRGSATRSCAARGIGREAASARTHGMTRRGTAVHCTLHCVTLTAYARISVATWGHSRPHPAARLLKNCVHLGWTSAHELRAQTAVAEKSAPALALSTQHVHPPDTAGS